jgi:hypothetical protein
VRSVIRLRREHADHLARRHRLAGRDGQLGDDPVPHACTSFSIFIASTMQITCPAHRIPLADLDREHRALHRADDRVAAAAAPPELRPDRGAWRRARPTAARGRAASRRSGARRARPRSPARAGRRSTAGRPRSTADKRSASSASCSDSTTPWQVPPSTKHGCRRSARWKPSSVVIPPTSNSSSARSIRLRACSRSTPCTISFANIGS